jgi:protein SCO1
MTAHSPSRRSSRTARRHVTVAAVAQCLLALSALSTAAAAAPVERRAAGNEASAPAKGLPSDSLFNVDVPLETAAGHSTSFAATGTRVQIVTMFYASCPMACPLTIDTLKNVESQLPAIERSKLGVLMVTVDPQNDTPAVLSAVAAERHVTDSRWTLARASSADTRKLAAVLGIQYRAMGADDFDHSSTLILLDRQGRVLARSSKLGVPDPVFVAAVRKALAAASLRASVEKKRI